MQPQGPGFLSVFQRISGEMTSRVGGADPDEGI